MKTNNHIVTKEISLKSILEKSGRIIIAGPCSAESQEQILETAKQLFENGRTHFMRAGIWKPRTSPGSFEGVGSVGFEWLKQAKAIYGLPIATEVGSVKHVAEALKHNVDLMWIGARTVSNPFLVQEIAEAIRGVDIPVLVKNPLSPDIDLWEGAINRFTRCGVKDVGAVHRGFSWQRKIPLRNQPLWEVPNELKQRIPSIPIICDPSHIAGNRNLVSAIAQRAIDNGTNGLMVEVHPNPDAALSDASQQLTPTNFFAMLNNKLDDSSNANQANELLEELRSEVDIIDELVVWALANRMELSQKIAGVKKTTSMKVLQQGRWEEVISRVTKMANEKGLDPIFVERLFNQIHSESCLIQKKLKSKKTNKSTKQATFIL